MAKAELQINCRDQDYYVDQVRRTRFLRWESENRYFIVHGGIAVRETIIESYQPWTTVSGNESVETVIERIIESLMQTRPTEIINQNVVILSRASGRRTTVTMHVREIVSQKPGVRRLIFSHP